MTKQKKVVTIISICAAVLIAGYLAISVLLPRIFLHNFIKESLPDVGSAAEFFTEYSIFETDDTINVSNGHISMDIPAEYAFDEEYSLETADLYKDNDKHSVILMDVWEWGDTMNLMSSFDSKDYNMDYDLKMGAEGLKKGFEKLGNGLPDSGFATYKCMYMLENSDYSFWNFNQQVAYMITGTMKTVLAPAFGDIYIYENGDICGFVHVRESENPDVNGKYSVLFQIYLADDLNTSSSVLIKTDSLEEAYAIMNSVKSA